MLIADGRITYGGHLEPEGYTAFLIHECEKYGSRNRPFTGCVPWSAHAGLTAGEIRLLRRGMSLLGQYVYLDAGGEVMHDPDAPRSRGRACIRRGCCRSPYRAKEIHDGAHRRATRNRRATNGLPGSDTRGHRGNDLFDPLRQASLRGGRFRRGCGDAVATLGLDPEGWLGLPDRSTEPDLIELAASAVEGRLGPDQQRPYRRTEPPTCHLLPCKRDRIPCGGRPNQHSVHS